VSQEVRKRNASTIITCFTYKQVPGRCTVHERPQKFFFFQGETSTFCLSRLLTMQCKWTFAKRFLEIPNHKENALLPVTDLRIGHGLGPQATLTYDDSC